MKNQYVILTGSKNNAGDFLIKYRAKQLFKTLRDDREIIDIDRWKPLSDDQLNEVNNSKALILMGGPAVQEHMYPDLYKMTSNLDDINVPIVTMGVGWYSKTGDWKDSYNYKLSPKTKSLLDRVENSGYTSSVRDYHTLNSLQSHGYNSFRMTGCPAYYDVDFIGQDFKEPNIEKVAFSLGVSFNHSQSMEKQLKENILRLKEMFHDKKFEVVFHHSLSSEKRSNGVSKSLFDRQQEIVKWLESKKIDYVDISGSAENLMNYYSTVDLHIGYRVHAHIFMNSIARFSILLNEDGRGKAVRNVIGGITIDAFFAFRNTFIYKKLYQLFNFDRYISNDYLTTQLLNEIVYEKNINYGRLKNSRKQIDQNFQVMKQFLEQLP